MRRDLRPAADLIELCFANSLTPDGHRYLQRMRAAAGPRDAANFSRIMAARASLPLAGYVWEEAGQLVGNLSLIPFFHRGRRIYLIANVAVHPDYRRRGIARSLTQAALEKSRRRRVSEIWLQARDDNPSALSLYTSMGFKAQAKRTTWSIRTKTLRGETPTGMRVTVRTGRHWNQQEHWLKLNYPPALRWHILLNDQAMKPGLLGFFYRFFSETEVRHWAAQSANRLLGVLTWQASHTHADHLWLAAPPETEVQALQTILPFIKQESRLTRPLTLEYPAQRAEDVFIQSGFEIHHTLVWMKLQPSEIPQ